MEEGESLWRLVLLFDPLVILERWQPTDPIYFDPRKLFSMRHLTYVFTLFAVSAMVGCGGESLDGTTAVTGTVTHNGSPVEGATVIFSPTGEGRAASGMTDASGKFQLTTLTASDGVMPGDYQVAVTKTVTEGGLTVEESQAYLEQHNEPPPAATTKEMLPKKYKNPVESGLKATVADGVENDFTFALTD